MYEPKAHYYRFDDEVGDRVGTLSEAIARAEEMRDARDPVHRDRTDMGASVTDVETGKCVWTDGGYMK